MIYDILPVNNYIGNNLSTTFDFDFYVDDKSQLKVYHYNSLGVKTLLKEGIDYSINEIKNKNGSHITFPIEGSSYSVLCDNEKISLELSLPVSQETQYNNSSLLNLTTLEYSLDYLTRLIQILKRKVELCVKVDEFSDNTPEDLIEMLNSKAILALDSSNIAQNALQNIQMLNDSIQETYNNVMQNASEFEKIAGLDELTQDLSSKLNAMDIKIDGQWKNFESLVVILSDATVAGSSTMDFDVSNVLPNDGCFYELAGSLSFKSGTNGASTVKSKEFNVGFSVRNPVANAQASCSGRIVVGLDRKVCIVTGSVALNAVYLSFNSYRRLGTNI